MDKINLNAKEITLMGALLGAEDLFGIDDGFGNVSEESMPSEIDAVQNSLAAKHVLDVDFDGNVAVPKSAEDFMHPLVECDCFLAFIKQDAGKDAEQRIVYKSKRGILISDITDSGYELESADVGKVWKDISSLVSGLPDSTLSFEPVSIMQSELDKIKHSESAINQLQEKGLNDQAAELIAKGFVGKADYMSLICTCPYERHNSVVGLQVLSGDRIALSLSPEIEDSENYVVIAPAPASYIASEIVKITEMFLRYGGEESENDFAVGQDA
jgi:hypothetical protein